MTLTATKSSFEVPNGTMSFATATQLKYENMDSFEDHNVLKLHYQQITTVDRPQSLKINRYVNDQRQFQTAMSAQKLQRQRLPTLTTELLTKVKMKNIINNMESC